MALTHAVNATPFMPHGSPLACVPRLPAAPETVSQSVALPAVAEPGLRVLR